MEFDTDRIRSLMTYRYDPGTTSPSPRYHHLEDFRGKEFRDGDVAELFHENTKYTENSHRSDLSTITLFVTDETMQLVQSARRNDYPGRETVELPEPEPELGVDLGAALSRRQSVRAYDGEPIGRQELSTLLGLALGTNGPLVPNGRKEGRTYPSGGGLYPVETYLAVVNGGPDLDAGLYYYVPEKHVLRVLDGDVTEAIDEAFEPPAELDPEDSALCFLFTAAFWRTYAKYGPRGYRFVLQESGHMCQNLQLVADAMGYGSVLLGAVYEDEINDLLELDGVDEGLVYTAFVGSPREKEVNAEGGRSVEGGRTVEGEQTAVRAGGDSHV